MDVRDVARAHVQAAAKRIITTTTVDHDGKKTPQDEEEQQQQQQQQSRYIVSMENRVPATEIADWLQQALLLGRRQNDDDKEEDPAAAAASKIYADTNFQAAVPIGEKEVEAKERLYRELGITLRPVRETFTDMVQILPLLLRDDDDDDDG